MDDLEALFDRRMIVIGAGGHAKVVIDVARAAGWVPVAALDPVGVGHYCADVPVIGSDDLATDLRKDGIRFAVVALGANGLRLRLGKKLEQIGFECPAILHPSVILSPYARVAAGTVVMPSAVINSHARIGEFAIINTCAIVEHDCTVGDGAHIAPRSVMGGNVDIGREALFGIGAVARPDSAVGAGATIGAGSTVIGAIDAGAMVAGTPARQLRGMTK
jgi:UDP-perosamine 4-acetyltransferase